MNALYDLCEDSNVWVGLSISFRKYRKSRYIGEAQTINSLHDAVRMGHRRCDIERAY